MAKEPPDPVVGAVGLSPYAVVYLRGEARAQVHDRLVPRGQVAVNVAVKCERKVSRRLLEAGVSINLVYLGTNTRG
jgi:hypothetical protein